MIDAWRRYWFSPSPLIDLAVVRIVCSTVTLFYCFIYHDYFGYLAERFAMDDVFFRPVFILKLVYAPFGWGYSSVGGADGLGVWAVRPSDSLVQFFGLILLVSGCLSLVGLFTRISLAAFAASFIYVNAYVHSFGDFHHPEAAMAFMLIALALSPAGGLLSVDNFRRKKGGQGRSIFDKDPLAGWAIKFMQWFFVLMYLSSFWAKLSIGGFSWMNGFTLQYYLIQDGLRNGRDLALYVAQFHWLILLGQWVVMVFQATFFVEVIIPKARWIYIPVGLFFHISIYVLLAAPFFTWMALYSIFIPWSAALLRLRQWIKVEQVSA